MKRLFESALSTHLLMEMWLHSNSCSFFHNCDLDTELLHIHSQHIMMEHRISESWNQFHGNDSFLKLQVNSGQAARWLFVSLEVFYSAPRS